MPTNQHESVPRDLVSVSLIRGIVGPGLNSSLGIFFSPVAAALGVGVGSLSLTVAVASLAGMLFLSLAAQMFEAGGVRVAAYCGAVLVCLSFAGQALGGHIVWWYLMAVPFGMGTVLLVNLLGPLYLHASDTEDSSFGARLGWMMALSGVIAVVLQPVLSHLVFQFGWRMGYLIGGIGSLFALLILIRLLPHRVSASEQSVAEEEQAPLHVPVLLSLYLGVISAFNAFHQQLAVYGQSVGYTARQVGIALSLSMAGAAVGGVLLGFVNHVKGAVFSGYTALAAGAVSLALLLMPNGSYSSFYIATILHGIASAAIGIPAQAILKDTCKGGYSRSLAVLLRAIPLASVIATPLLGYSYDITGSYDVAHWALLALLAVGAVSLLPFTQLFANKKQKA